jgi:hypothetical protein
VTVSTASITQGKDRHLTLPLDLHLALEHAADAVVHYLKHKVGRHSTAREGGANYIDYPFTGQHGDGRTSITPRSGQP